MQEEIYGSFARVYDTFMDTVPYEEWCAVLTRLLKEDGIEDGLVLDLGCGTGSMTRLLSKAGYDMIGVDASPQMLQIAREKGGWDDSILYLLQDMRAFELYGTVRAVVSVCDSLNYLSGTDELTEVFRLVNNYLDPGGLFLFDMNTLYKYRELLGERTFAENREDCSFIWENAWYEQERENEYDLTLFVREKNGLFRRYEEVHVQHAFETQEIITALEAAGLSPVSVTDAYTGEPPRSDSERLLFAARECVKKHAAANAAFAVNSAAT